MPRRCPPDADLSGGPQGLQSKQKKTRTPPAPSAEAKPRESQPKGIVMGIWGVLATIYAAASVLLAERAGVLLRRHPVQQQADDDAQAEYLHAYWQRGA